LGTLFGQMLQDTDFQPILSERLRLRRSVAGDAEAIAAYRSDPDVSRYQGWDRTDVDSIRADLQMMASRVPGDPGWVQFSVEERETGALVGDVGLSPGDEPGVIKIGYTIAPAYQGRGYATEAVRALIDYAFDTLGAEIVRAYASALNKPSHRLAERVGMRLMETFEGENDGVRWSGVRFDLPRAEREGQPDR
jgi:RimJ/RimL family protein N-acetyltransferase